MWFKKRPFGGDITFLRMYMKIIPTYAAVIPSNRGLIFAFSEKILGAFSLGVLMIKHS